MIHDHRNGTSVYTLRAIDVLLTVLWDVTRMPATLSRNCYISMCLSFAIINGFAEFDDIEEGLDSGEPLFIRNPSLGFLREVPSASEKTCTAISSL